MKKGRRVLVAGLGALTPAFVTGAAQARLVEPATIAESGAPQPSAHIDAITEIFDVSLASFNAYYEEEKPGPRLAATAPGWWCG